MELVWIGWMELVGLVFVIIQEVLKTNENKEEA